MFGGSLVILVVGFGFLPKNFGRLAAQSRDIMTSLVGNSQQAATFVKLSQFLSHIGCFWLSAANILGGVRTYIWEPCLKMNAA